MAYHLTKEEVKALAQDIVQEGIGEWSQDLVERGPFGNVGAMTARRRGSPPCCPGFDKTFSYPRTRTYT